MSRSHIFVAVAAVLMAGHLPASALAAAAAQETDGAEQEAVPQEAETSAELAAEAEAAADAARAVDGAAGGAPHPHEDIDFQSEEIEAAAAAGLAWLELIDAGEFEESWATGSSTLQNSASPQSLRASIRDGRQAFQPLGTRTLQVYQQMTNPANAPPGEYVMLQYRTEASGGRTVIETVVPRQDDDAWRVAAYFIQRE